MCASGRGGRERWTVTRVGMSTPLTRPYMLSLAARRLGQRSRTLSTAATHPRPSSAYTDTSRSKDPAVATTPDNLSPQQREALDRALRVDQAGEVAANWIYKGQFAVLGRDHAIGPLIQVSISLYDPLYVR
jgi:3-demethoxyubiquinol 3-hydroxylase